MIRSTCKRGLHFFATAAVWVVCTAGMAQRATSFPTEGPLPHATAAPAAVLKLLAQEPQVQDNMADQRGEPVPTAWISAAQLSLGRGAPPAILVRGNPPLSGAHSGWFWIYMQRGGRWRRVLFVAADEVDVTESARAGIADVESSTVAGDRRTWHFDGQLYQPARGGRARH